MTQTVVPYTVHKNCHTGPVKVLTFKSSNTSVWAGSFAERWVNHPDPWTLRIALGGFAHDDAFFPSEHGAVRFFNTGEVISPELTAELERKARRETVLGVDWTDMGVPYRLDREWFKSVQTMIASLPANSDVYVHCYGGHGRTGTFLAILASLSGACPKGSDPVEWLRLRYCDHAVESDSQLDWIEKITGEKVASKAHKSYVSHANWTGGSAATPKTFQETKAPDLFQHSALSPAHTSGGDTAPSEGETQGGKAPPSTAPFDFAQLRDWYAGDAWIRAEVAELIESESASSTSWVIAAWMAARKRARDIAAPVAVTNILFPDFQRLCTDDLRDWKPAGESFDDIADLNHARNWWLKTRLAWDAAHLKRYPDRVATK